MSLSHIKNNNFCMETREVSLKIPHINSDNAQSASSLVETNKIRSNHPTANKGFHQSWKNYMHMIRMAQIYKQNMQRDTGLGWPFNNLSNQRAAESAHKTWVTHIYSREHKPCAPKNIHKANEVLLCLLCSALEPKHTCIRKKNSMQLVHTGILMHHFLGFLQIHD